MARIGILGGTFNPPHIGHLVCAQEARYQLGLGRVLLVPVSLPPHKEATDDPGAAERVELCRLAVAGEDGLEVSTLEVERGGASYTVDTLREIHVRAPGDELTFIVGADVARALPAWREPAAVLELATLAVADRAGVERAEIVARLAPLGGEGRIAFFQMPRLDVSSSDIRRRAAEGAPIRHLVPPALAEHIAEHGLYRVAAGKGVG
jgi:nicotinate-nucleotide adenylyltransferase